MYVRSNGVWSEQAEANASDGAAGDYFGISVSIDGDTAVIGAHVMMTMALLRFGLCVCAQ